MNNSIKEFALNKLDTYCMAAKQINDVDKIFKNEHDQYKKIYQSTEHCTDCGQQIYRADGCIICPNPECGWSKC